MMETMEDLSFSKRRMAKLSTKTVGTYNGIIKTRLYTASFFSHKDIAV